MEPVELRLRDYQERAMSDLRDLRGEGVDRVLLVLPTGGGKTEIGAALFAEEASRGNRSLWLTHRLELVDQAAERIRRYGAKVGIIQADTRPDPTADVQVASVGTISRRAEVPPASLVITDEAHHAVSPSFAGVLARYPAAFHVGLTATPYRLDGQGLGDVFDRLLVVAHPQELVDLKFLVAPRIFTPAPPDLAGIRVSHGDFEQGALSQAMSKLTGDVVRTWKQFGQGRKTVAFAVDVAHSKALAERFNAEGIPAEHFDGSDDQDTRRGVLERFRSGETVVLCNCQLISEGFDLPDIGCVVMARPTMSRGLYRQQIGRAMRRLEGKVDCILIDNAGNFGRHGHPLDVEEYELFSKVKVTSPIKTKTCPECFSVVPAHVPECPYCHHRFAGEARKIRETAGELVEVSALRARYALMTLTERRAVYEQLAARAKACGYKIGWAGYQYQARFGEFPPGEFRASFEAGTSAPTDALTRWIVTGSDRGYKPGWALYQFRLAYGRWPRPSERSKAQEAADVKSIVHTTGRGLFASSD